MTVFRVLDDGNGSFWVSSSTGIFRLNKKSLDDYAEGRVKQIQAFSYGISDGLLSRECNGGQPAGDRTPDGRLWFPTMKGLGVVNPRHLYANTLPPQVLVERVRADGRDHAFSSPIKVAAGSRTLQLEYTGLSLAAPEKVQFRYRLLPFESDWVDSGTRRVAMYTSVDAGRHGCRERQSSRTVHNEGHPSCPFFRRSPNREIHGREKHGDLPYCKRPYRGGARPA